MSTWPMFINLREHHCISPELPVPYGGEDEDPLDDGIRNAWFPAVQVVQRSVRLHLLHTPIQDASTLATL